MSEGQAIPELQPRTQERTFPNVSRSFCTVRQWQRDPNRWIEGHPQCTE